MIKKLGLALLTSAIASMSMASVESVQANLKKNYPNINVQNIQKTEMSGIYSGSLDGEIVYLGEAAEHVIARFDGTFKRSEKFKCCFICATKLA